jgi:hypothetical protein
MEKSKIYIVFNSTTRKPVFIVDSLEAIQNTGFTLIKEVEIEGNEINLARFKWIGDYDTGKFTDLFLEKKAIVTEEEVDNKYYGMFFRKYSMEEAVFNLIKHAEFRHTSEIIDGKDYFTDNNEGGYMKRFLESLLKKKEKEIQTYKNSPNHIYETKADQEKRLEESFKIN